jgi:predicted alpha/beta hydrolase family esterase
VPLPSEKLAFPSVVVSSSNDPYGREDHARAPLRGAVNGIDAGVRGHLNA